MKKMLTAGVVEPCPCSSNCRMSRAELRDPKTGGAWIGLGSNTPQALRYSFDYYNKRTRS